MNKHPYTRSFAALPLIVVLAVILVGGGVYVYRNTSPIQPVATTTPSEEVQLPQKQNPSPIQNMKGEILSFTITPSTKDQIWTMYRSGAKAVVRGKNLTSVEVRYVYTGTEVQEISSAGMMSKVNESTQEQTWELVLPPALLTTKFWAEGKDLTGQNIKSTDLGNVGYEE